MRQWTTLHKYIWLRAYQIASAVYETIKGAIISFVTEKAAPLKELKVEFSPVQDLHGYDSPWPAGGGKNKFDGTFLQGYWAYANGSWTNSSGWIATQKIPCKPSTYYTASADAKATRWQGFVWYDSNGDYISTDNLQSNIDIGLTKQSPNNAAYLAFNIAATDSNHIVPSDVTHFQLEEGQTATSYAPYENECPILGWDSLNVEQRGKNLWGKQLGNNTYVEFDTVTGEQYTVSAKMIDPEAGTYLLISKVHVETSTWTTVAYVISNRTVTPRTFTAEDGYRYALWSNSSYTNIEEVQIELGSTASPYQPYNPASRTIPVTFPAVGKNLLNKADGTFSQSVLYFGGNSTETDGTLSLKAGTYTASASESMTGIYIYTADGTRVGVAYNNTKCSFTIESDSDVRVQFYLANSTAETFATINLQLESGSSATAYEPYTNTVYSGWANIVTGAGKITGIGTNITDKFINASWYADDIAAGRSSIGFYRGTHGWISQTGLPLPADNFKGQFSYCKVGTVYNNDNHWNAEFLFTGAFNRFEIRLPISVLADVSTRANAEQSARDYLTAHPLQAYYKIEPVDFQLTPQQINSLKGDNTMWANTNGEIEATYRSN